MPIIKYDMKNERRSGLTTEALYRIVVGEHVSPAGWPASLELKNDYDGEGTPVTTITGLVKDQSMLHGIIEKIRDLGLSLVSIEKIQPNT